MLEEIEKNDEPINKNHQTKLIMGENSIILDYLDRYHAGEILEEDFQKRMESDSELQQIYVEYQQDLLVIREGVKEQLKKKVALTLEVYEEKKVKTFPLKRIFLVAASVTFIVVSIFLFRNMNSSTSSVDLYAAHFELPSAAGERSISEQSDAWNDAMTAYANQDFKTTIDLLSSLVNQPDFSFADRGNLYLGLSLLMQNENQMAVKHFEAINRESSFIQDGEWYKALAFLRINDLENAQYTLQKIVDQPRHFKYHEALEILKQLQ